MVTLTGRSQRSKIPLLMLFLFFLINDGSSLLAQAKFEKERRIDKSDVPDQASSFINRAEIKNKIKWYQETRLAGYSFEAKTKLNSNKYSIEFDSTGILEDIEVEVSWEQITKEAQVGICTYLEEFADIFKIRKIQSQFTGPDELLLKYLKTTEVTDGITVAYELVANVKKGKNRNKYEFLFSCDGDLLRQEVIIDRITDNLEY